MPPPAAPKKGAKPSHHDFQDVMDFLRQIRRKRTHGATILKWRDGEVVNVNHEDGYQPGELPLVRVSAAP